MGRKDRRSEEVPGQHRAEEAEVEELGGRGGAARRAGAHSVVVAPSKTKTAGGGEEAMARGWCSRRRCGRAWRWLGVAAERGKR
uniref:Uncharacterized protein n=1 Tax=Oryza rufipogon TaxID=4529 RepID=A0A0E0Q7Z3_ORYRU